MADIEMTFTNKHGAAAGAAEQQLLQEMEEYIRRTQQGWVQPDGDRLTGLENT